MINKKYNIFFTLFLFACSQNNIGYEYLGAKYQLDPLGEETSPDTDPLIRTDAFDCVTFVETALADGNLNKLNKIRYKNGYISFFNRNNIIETDWLANNSDLIQDITNVYGNTKNRNVIIDKKTWFNVIHNVKYDTQSIETTIKYLPYSDINNIENDESLLVLFIIDNPKIHDKIGTDLAISHMGFLLPNGILRHASSAQKKVVDINFIDYVNTRKSNKTNLGIALYKIK